jgi:hypothetical protein
VESAEPISWRERLIQEVELCDVLEGSFLSGVPILDVHEADTLGERTPPRMDLDGLDGVHLWIHWGKLREVLCVSVALRCWMVFRRLPRKPVHFEFGVTVQEALHAYTTPREHLAYISDEDRADALEVLSEQLARLRSGSSSRT